MTKEEIMQKDKEVKAMLLQEMRKALDEDDTVKIEHLNEKLREYDWHNQDSDLYKAFEIWQDIRDERILRYQKIVRPVTQRYTTTNREIDDYHREERNKAQY